MLDYETVKNEWQTCTTGRKKNAVWLMIRMLRMTKHIDLSVMNILSFLKIPVWLYVK